MIGHGHRYPFLVSGSAKNKNNFVGLIWINSTDDLRSQMTWAKAILKWHYKLDDWHPCISTTDSKKAPEMAVDSMRLLDPQTSSNLIKLEGLGLGQPDLRIGGRQTCWGGTAERKISMTTGVQYDLCCNYQEGGTTHIWRWLTAKQTRKSKKLGLRSISAKSFSKTSNRTLQHLRAQAHAFTYQTRIE